MGKIKIKNLYILFIFIISIFNNFIYADNSEFNSGTNLSGNINNQGFDIEKIVDIEIQKELSKKSSTAISIDDFRGRKMDDINKLYEDSNFQIVYDSERVKENLDLLSGQYREVQQKFDEIKNRKVKIDSKYNDILETIKVIMKDIIVSRNEVNDRLLKIKDYSIKLKNLQNQIDEVKLSIDETKNHLGRYTNMLYKINNDYYSDNLYVDDLKLFVKSNNIAETLSTQEILNSLTFKLDELLEVIGEKHNRYVKYSNLLSEMKLKYGEEITEYKRNVESLNQQKKHVLDLFDFFKNDKVDLDEKYEQLVKNKTDLKNQIVNILTEKKQQIEVSEMTNGFNVKQLLKDSDKEDSDKFFSWPLLPVGKISAFYDDPKYEKKFGVLHKGIDVPGYQGQEIYAPANGIVYKVVDQDGPGINRMIVFHKYGYVTVYIHNYKIFVNEGDYIKRGQLIGLVGGKPGTRGSGLLSTGPHLHFEIIKNGEYLDPLTNMDLSVIRSKNILDKKYYLKYLKDRYSRNIDLTTITVMPGNSISERRNSFLKKFASGQYSNPALWQDAANGKNLDVDLGICIAFAETGIGKAYAKNSLYNVGNVGNNDRGDRRGFSSPLVGAIAIYNTLNNNYLGNHQTLDQLSRYGNKNGSIFASDPIKWQTNIVKCLSVIKGYWIPDEYPFRRYSKEWEEKNVKKSNILPVANTKANELVVDKIENEQEVHSGAKSQN